MKRNFNIIIRAAFAIAIVYFLFNAVRIIYDVNQVQKDVEEVSEKVDAKEEEVAKLKHRFETPVDDDYLERVAKENGLYYPDEIIFHNNFGK